MTVLTTRRPETLESASRERLLALLVDDAAAYGVIVMDAQGIIRRWNAGAERIFGFTAEEVCGKRAEPLFIPEDRELGMPRRELQHAARTGQAEDERWHQHKDGRRIWLSGITWALKDEEGRLIGYSKVVRELTVRKNTADELKAAASRLQQFAYIASHDLDEPLRMVCSFLELVASRTKGKLDAEAEEYLGYARTGAQRMKKILTDVIESSRVGVDRKLLAPSDLNSIVDAAVGFMKRTVEAADATVTHSGLPVATVVATQIEQVFQNLISNAIKFRSEAPPLIFVDCDEGAGEYHFTVRDNGVGIPAHRLERIFEVYPRVVTADDYPGTGLGLAICRRIVERHLGRIWIESESGKGTTVHFTISKALAR